MSQPPNTLGGSSHRGEHEQRKEQPVHLHPVPQGQRQGHVHHSVRQPDLRRGAFPRPMPGYFR